MDTHGRALLLAVALSAGAPRAVAGDAGATPALVVCAPGSPGTTEEAQGAMDAFAAAVTATGGLPPGALAATYAASEDAGVARLAAPDAAVALVSLPFLLKHERALGLRPAGLRPVPLGGDGTETWSLVARKGKVAGAASLDGFTILSTAGWAPRFVAGPALAGLGKLPAGVKIAPTAAILSALRKAAAGEPVAVLLDGAQTAALPSLAFAADLEIVARSAPLPVGVVARVGDRLPRERWARVEAGLRALSSTAEGAAALAGIRMVRFDPLDERALASARKAYAETAR